MARLKEKIVTLKNGLEVIIKSPIAGEGADLLACVKDVMVNSRHLLTTPEEFTYTIEQEDQLIQQYLDHPDFIMITPRVGDRIVGMMDFRVKAQLRIRHQGEFGMSVHPEYQGLGIGRYMLDALIEWATENPRIETLRLSVHARNTQAIELYQKCGFVVEGREVRGVKFANGVYDDVVRMARPVPTS